MSNVEEWAKQEADAHYKEGPWDRPMERAGARWMAEHLVALLLSDEVVEVLACREPGWSDLRADERDVVRARVRADFQAALDKITEQSA